MKIDNDKLRQKAKMVVYAIYLATQQFEKTIDGKVRGVKPIKELANISKEEKGLVSYLVMVNFLFQAQKFFWERVITNEETAREFEKYLYEAFEQLTEVDPKPYIQEIGAYIERQGNKGQLMYLGSKICKELQKEDAILMLKINTIYSSLLKYGFFESLKNAWEMEPKKEGHDKS